MTFEDDFPSLKEFACWGRNGDLHYPVLPTKIRAIIQKHCLDKAKVNRILKDILIDVEDLESNNCDEGGFWNTSLSDNIKNKIKELKVVDKQC